MTTEHIELVSGSPPEKPKNGGNQRNSEVALGTYQDPYNKPELEHTLKGRELYVFVLFYTVAVLLIVLMFEVFMPVLFNPNYPNGPDE